MSYVIEYAEEASSGRSKCMKCHEIIPKGEIRVMARDNIMKAFICKDCGKILINERIEDLKYMLEKIRED